jgi:type II secretion system protein L
VTAPGVNLLQGAYARRSGLAAYWPAWRTAAALAAMLLCLLLVADGLELLRLRRETAALDQRIAQAVNYTFPGSGPLKDTARDVEARLRSVGSGTDPRASREFLDSMRAVSQAIAAVTGTRIEGLSYKPGSLELRLRAPAVDALDRVQKLISQTAGLRAELQSTNADGNEVRGRIQVRRAAGS